jgi:hypothetical protein
MNARTLVLSLALASSGLVGCGGPLRYMVASSARAPGADADIVAKVNEGQHQTQLEVVVKNLAPADRVAPGSTVYVAWWRRDVDTSWVRLAAINYDADERGGTLTASAPEVAFDFQISAEAEATPEAPSESVVFFQRVAE